MERFFQCDSPDALLIGSSVQVDHPGCAPTMKAGIRRLLVSRRVPNHLSAKSLHLIGDFFPPTWSLRLVQCHATACTNGGKHFGWGRPHHRSRHIGDFLRDRAMLRSCNHVIGICKYQLFIKLLCLVLQHQQCKLSLVDILVSSWTGCLGSSLCLVEHFLCARHGNVYFLSLCKRSFSVRNDLCLTVSKSHDVFAALVRSHSLNGVEFRSNTVALCLF